MSEIEGRKGMLKERRGLREEKEKKREGGQQGTTNEGPTSELGKLQWLPRCPGCLRHY